MVDLRPGETYVPGVNSHTARALLDAAAKAGLNPKTAVRTTEGGFVVPDEIAPKPARQRTARILPVDPPPEPATPSPKSPSRRKKSTK